MSNKNNNETIIALATNSGISALAIIRVSGIKSYQITKKIFRGKDILLQKSHTLHFGLLEHKDTLLDEVVISLFKAPYSFTKEDSIEISCHGSPFIIEKIIKAYLDEGARLAKPGEFTQRAFLNGRFDLAQAEAISDLIYADSAIAHQTALNQIRGGFSQKIKNLRQKLIWFASLIELELDFGEEDVEFANRPDLENLVNEILTEIQLLTKSFQTGNVIKNGVPTVIAGKPNAGKSTLLNALLNEERAIVSEIAGTTRDSIEDTATIEGITFRFIDTAGLRETTDKIEKIGVQRTQEKMKQASLILYLIDTTNTDEEEIIEQRVELNNLEKDILFIGNKSDIADNEQIKKITSLLPGSIFISADKKTGLDTLKNRIVQIVKKEDFRIGDTIVTNLRHYESLVHTKVHLESVEKGLKTGITGDILAMDIRHALYELGQITGEITTEDILDTIFSKFCIGK